MPIPEVAGDLKAGLDQAVNENIGRQLVVVPLKSYR